MKINYMNLKKIGAVLLALSFFLPLSRCDESGWDVYEAEQASQPMENIEADYEYFYAWEAFFPGEGNQFEPGLALLVLLAFTWPVLFLVFRQKIQNRKINTSLLFLEPLIAGGGSYFVLIINMFNELYFGFYVAILGAFAFFSGAVIEIVQRFKKRKLK